MNIKHFLLIFTTLIQQILGFNNFYDLTAIDIRGNQVEFTKYKGKVVLVTNVASECGYTDTHYKAYIKLHDILNRNNKFTILAFPCNQFGNQEPALDHQIELFIRSHYKAEFPMFAKVDVIGSNASVVFKYLSEQTNQAPDWNFWKYLVNHEGSVLNSWGPQTSVNQIFDTVKEAVEKAEEVLPDKNKTEL